MRDVAHGERVAIECDEIALALRRRQPLAFSGTYTPLGANPATTCAFSRGDDVVVVVATRDEPADATMPVGDWRNVLSGLDPERLLFVSPSFERVWGLSADGLYRNPRLWTERIHPDDRPRVTDRFTRWIAGEDVDFHDVEYRIIQL